MPEDESQKKEINMLKAELALLRANIKKTESENNQLRGERCKFTMEKIELEQEIKKRIISQSKEEKITENRLKMFKSGEPNDSTRSRDVNKQAIPPSFVLCRAIDESDLDPEESLQKLKFFRDYFFDDFFSIPDEKALKIVEYCFKHSARLFIDAYALFYCKRSVFQHFAQAVFESNIFLQQKIELLEGVPPEWTLSLLETHLKRFLVENKKKALYFISRLAERCPSYLSKVFSRRDFTDLLIERSPIGNKIIKTIAIEKLDGYVDETNLHLVPKSSLKILFEGEFVDIL